MKSSLVEAPEVEKTGAQPVMTSGSPLPTHSSQRSHLRRWTILLGGLVVLGILVVFALRWPSMRRSGSSGLPLEAYLGTVRRGDLVRTLRIQGTVEAVSFYTIAAPRLSGPGMGTLIVTKIAASGNSVKKGDLLVTFDRQTQIRNALDRQAEYVDFVGQLKKMQADQVSAKASDETALLQAEDALKSAALELKRNEIVSKIDAEKNQENYEQAKATYQQLKQTFGLKRAAAEAEVKSMEIQRDRALAAFNYAQDNSKKLEIHSPLDGIVVLTSIWKGGRMGEAQEGDEVRPGIPFLQVVNAGAMQIRARINQADMYSLHPGQQAAIGLDAYPELAFKGKLLQVAAIGVTSGLSDKVRTFQGVFSIEGNDAKLMPDLSAFADVELERRTGVLMIPRDCVHWENGRSVVSVWNGISTSKRGVELGEENDTEVVVRSGLDENARVLRNTGSNAGIVR